MRTANHIDVHLPNLIPNEIVSDALAYVSDSEIRVRSVSVDGSDFVAELECRSPTYTSKAVEYLSTSELAISSAQFGQVVLHILVGAPSFEYRHMLTPERLSLLRNNHQVYFLNWQLRFRRISKCADYVMTLTVDRVFTRKTSIFAQCSFRVGKAVEGSFTALIPGEEIGGAP
ncbi:MAG: hypothetical protein IPM03_06590 [Sulfuritalea sp.]|nr:hypothetical protein [Sulfuritalea sp.]